ncbi:MAG: hypothetical protein K0A94_11150 [Desulfuromonadales bacterium]|nr:hypothetical protein [Desulfuromonadales bacterium]
MMNTTEQSTEHFRKILWDRLQRLDTHSGTGNTEFHTVTERLTIQIAFNRLDNNEYNKCIKCNGIIAATRLFANPTALTCDDCDLGKTA